MVAERREKKSATSTKVFKWYHGTLVHPYFEPCVDTSVRYVIYVTKDKTQIHLTFLA